MFLIRPATASDAGEVFTVQRAGFVSEAQQHDDAHLPPLTETLDDLRAAIATGTVLVAVDGERIVGSVRASDRDGDWFVGRLVVAPDRQGEGIGRALLREIELAAPPSAGSFTLVTGPKSESNVRFYERNGYHQVPNDSILIRLTKPRETAS